MAFRKIELERSSEIIQKLQNFVK